MRRNSINLLVILCLLFHPLGCCKKGKNGQRAHSFETVVTPDVCRTFRKVWWHDQFTSDDYMLAAEKMIKYAEITENQHLTLGNVIKILGYPDSLSTDFEYAFDGNDNVVGDVTHTEITYNKYGVVIGFSTTGFIISIMQQVGPEKLSGLSSFSWPQQIPDGTKLPLLTGTFEPSDVPDDLIDIASSLERENPKEIDWYRLIVGPNNPLTGIKERTYLGRCAVRVALVDGISDTIARVHYRIEGGHTLYYDSWWFRKNSEWKRITAAQAEEVLTSTLTSEQK